MGFRMHSPEPLHELVLCGPRGECDGVRGEAGGTGWRPRLSSLPVPCGDSGAIQTTQRDPSLVCL